MKKISFKIFIVSLILMLITSVVPMNQVKATDEVVPLPKLTKGITPVELEEERTENELVYDNQNGTFTKQIFTEPINVKEDGKWERVSNELELTSDDFIEAENTEIKAAFLPEMEKGKYSIFGEGNESIAFSLVSAEGESGKSSIKDVKSEITENEIIFKNILPNTDLRSLNFNTSVKEDIVVNEYNGINEYTFKLNTKLNVNKLDDGSIVFTNKKGKVLFTLPKPVMTDSNIHEMTGEATSSDDVEFIIKQLTSSSYELKLVADLAWLKDEEREYPVYIDPSVQLKKSTDASIASVAPTTNYSGSKLWDAGLNEYVLKVGRYDDTTGFNYAYIKPDTSSLANATIESATFKTYAVWHYSSTAKNPVNLEEVTGDWTPNAVTWNTRPTTFNIGSVDIGRNQWASFDVTSSVRAWTTGLRPNKGFMMHTVNQQDHWKKFTATETGKNVPYLEVTYTYAKPAKPEITTYSNGPKTGNGYMDISWAAVPGATGYKVVIGNGYNYEYFSAGNTTTWSTKGKKIFPTQEEIDDGEYSFHTDGKGTEFANDPRSLYENGYQAGSTFGLRNQQKYIVRVIATFPGGDSPSSDITEAYMPLETPSTPTGKAYANLAGTNSGYVQVNWLPIANAEGYKVSIFDGKKNVLFDVGNKTTWTTQGKGIWPTEGEIAAGGWTVHTDGKGAELAQDPSSVYRNSGGVYGERKNYWFRVQAYTKTGKQAESKISDVYTPIIPQVDSQQGMVNYWTSIPVVGGEVNATNGNFLFSETDFELAGRGNGIQAIRTFNSQNEVVGIFGKGWSSNLEERLIEKENGDVALLEADNKVQNFVKKGQTYESPSGYYSELTKGTDEFSITTEEGTVVKYNLAGQKLSETDSRNNKTTFDYSNGKLIKITDASGRKVSINYDNDLVSNIVIPEERSIKFIYDDKKHLISSSTPRGKFYKYGYTDDLLTSIYDPKHTDEQPYKTSYEYVDKKLVSITDAVGKKSSIAYNNDAREAVLTNEKGKKTSYSYNQAGNPEKTVVDTAGLKLTTSYQYEANNLVKEVSPKGQIDTYSYDADGNLVLYSDSYGTEKYSYNENGDITSLTGTQDQEISVAYDGADAVSETLESNSLASIFTQYNEYGSPIANSKILTTGENIIKNGGFEKALDSSEWFLQNFQTANGTISQDTANAAPGALSGGASLKVNTISTGLGFTAGKQLVELEPDTKYTFSSYIKTANMKDTNVFFNVELQDDEGKRITDGEPWKNNRFSDIKSNRSWTKRQFTFTTTKTTARAYLFLEVEQNKGTGGTGTAWFDNIQLNKGEISSSYNPVLNSSFLSTSDTSAPNWYKGSTQGVNKIAIDSYGYGDDASALIQRTAYTDPDSKFGQEIVLNQKTAKNITVSGMSQSENIVTSGTGQTSNDYAILAEAVYSDGVTKSYYAKFPVGTNYWNRSAVTIKADKPIVRVKVWTVFRGNMKGKAWFDDIRLIEGEVLSEDSYDSVGNYITESKDTMGNTSKYKYDIFGNLLSETDPNGNSTTFDYNLDNQLIKMQSPNGSIIENKYDDNSNMTEKNVTADGRTKVNSFKYDVDNKITEFKDSLGRTLTYGYDAESNPTTMKMPKGNVIENTYDSASRLDTVKWNGVIAFKFQYDPNGNETKVTDEVNKTSVSKTYDEADRITNSEEAGSSVTYTYKDSPSPGNKGRTDNVKDIIISNGVFTGKANYDYNDLNQNISVFDGQKQNYYQFNEHGDTSSFTLGNSTSTNFNYDSADRVEEIQTGNKDGLSILDESYEYDKAGNRTTVSNKELGDTSYKYDSSSQLVQEKLANGDIYNYSYDGFGNRLTFESSGSKKQSFVSSYNDGNQLTSINGSSITYDSNGNRLSDESYKYTWDDGDRLSTVAKIGSETPFVEYKYDDDNRRISKTIEGITTNYHYDGDSIDVLYETNINGAITKRYIYNDNGVRIAMQVNGKYVYYHYNAHGDVVSLTDSSGAVIGKYSYDAWGNIQSSEETTSEAKQNSIGYAGYNYDKETGLYYLSERYYNPSQAVFLSAKSKLSQEEESMTKNAYSYAENNPIMNIVSNGYENWHIVNGGFDRIYLDSISK
ncbi:DNRLRE domain-containing protein [Listeria booriae]|uniref:RHS repeat protein n=1 Tax=Listeria booriae TaxID=1552123 RepID=A0A841XV40_9LIST|nr:DNRLRE domain-containing protein [Listeria booriae]MBC1316909.1 RHS repeat protein [Listeria booriae]